MIHLLVPLTSVVATNEFSTLFCEDIFGTHHLTEVLHSERVIQSL